MRITRREFGRLSSLGGLALLNESPEKDGISSLVSESDAAKDCTEDTEIPAEASNISKISDISKILEEEQGEKDRVSVAIVKTANRAEGIARAVALLGETDFGGKEVYLKGSYNSPDPFPATTHPEALDVMVRMLRGKGAGGVTLVERSGMGRTRGVLGKLGVLTALKELDVTFRPLDELSAGEWRHFMPANSHWPKGFAFPRFLTPDKCIVQLCNLKTHRFGGEFSASMKNSIGLIAKYAAAADSRPAGNDEKNPGRGWNYMKDLHASPYQEQMIAEANRAYAPEFTVMDAVEVFVEGGPERGETASPEIIAASRDRVALDAVGVAILLYAGARLNILEHVFELAQLRRAAELKLGVDSSEKIRVVSDDGAGRLLAARLQSIL